MVLAVPGCQLGRRENAEACEESRFSEEQIITILKKHRAGIALAKICRKHGIGDATSYNWRSKYGRVEVPGARRLKALKDEHGGSRM